MNARVFPWGEPEAAPLRTLRSDVRTYLKEQIQRGRFRPSVDGWSTGWDEDFSKDLASRGWVGMTIPTEFGGHGKSFAERFVVTEELLASGAPVAAHWVADRQMAPSLLRYGSDGQKRRFLPEIARGESHFAIGMSEPDSGSDLASVRTKATQTKSGWKVSGSKVWTSGAHKSTWVCVLARTAPVDPHDRHAGLSQFIVNLASAGVEIRPIISMSGHHHFNEVFFDDVVVPDELVLGQIGEGWRQVTSELGFERSGPERYLSTYLILAEVIRQVRAGALPHTTAVGQWIARLAGLRKMAFSVATAIDRGESVNSAAAIVKSLGTKTEGEIVEFADRFHDQAGQELAVLRQYVETGLLQRPSFTLRGGTNEILRGVIAREIGLRG
ncbi:acyl-CoA dehydrogenase family protein [Phytohabitans kaempferiae]|uniref:Acyl-CoA dehydrogenase family protein n=1 Tax=Phytohabitans kaempferiae TaxID=1620943 RepID=A0ABV6MHA2_9ACTN